MNKLFLITSITCILLVGCGPKLIYVYENRKYANSSDEYIQQALNQDTAECQAVAYSKVGSAPSVNRSLPSICSQSGTAAALGCGYAAQRQDSAVYRNYNQALWSITNSCLVQKGWTRRIVEQ